jgi:tetratricopeptide (TPR) repeat protein
MQRVEAAFTAQDYATVEQLIWPALDQLPQVAATWFYAGNLMMAMGRTAIGIACLEQAYRLDGNPHILINLTAAYRRLNDYDRGMAVGQLAAEKLPNNAGALSNFGSLWVNEGDPYGGIPHLERAVQVSNGAESSAAWNLGLLYLEAGRFAEGFELYHGGLGRERLLRLYAADGDREPEVLTRDAPRAGKRLVVWGEQGIGDELMFATLLPLAAAEFGSVVFECHPRLEQIHRTAFGHLANVEIHPTRKDSGPPPAVTADYKAPLGDLAWLYRPDRASFGRYTPIYRATDPAAAREYRQRLEFLAAGRPIVGLAMRGGVMQTARSHRTLSPREAIEMMRHTDALFVGLDYEDMTEFASTVAEALPGQQRYLFPASITIHWDYHHMTNLLHALDLTVTVCQSVAHLAAGMGVPTRVLTPARCAWRYGTTEEAWYWYDQPQVRLCRQPREGEDAFSWTPALARVIADIRGLRP